MMCRLGLLKAGPPPVVLEIINAVADNTGSSSSHNFSIPTGIVAGNLLVAIMGTQQAVTISWPAGWTEITSAVGATMGVSVAYRFATGSEGSSITCTTSGTCRGVQRAFRILGAHASAPPEAIMGAEISTANPNPPSLSPSWGLGTNYTLWIAFVNMYSTSSPSAYPSNYTLWQDHQAGSADNGLSTAARQNQVASEDAGTFGFSGADNAIAGNIAVRPV